MSEFWVGAFAVLLGCFAVAMSFSIGRNDVAKDCEKLGKFVAGGVVYECRREPSGTR